MKNLLVVAIALAFGSVQAFAEDKALPGASGSTPVEGGAAGESTAPGSDPSASGGTSATAGGMFDKLDQDCDGYLSAKELQVSADLKLKLEHIDADGDGKVSREEFVTAFEQGPDTDTGAAGRGGQASPKPTD